MNEHDVVKYMIEFVEQKEREIATSKLASATQNKGDVVKAILEELDEVTANENQ